MFYIDSLKFHFRSYAHFCRCGERIGERMKEQGASEFTPSVKIDREDWKTIHSWMDCCLGSLDLLNLSPERSKLRGK